MSTEAGEVQGRLFSQVQKFEKSNPNPSFQRGFSRNKLQVWSGKRNTPLDAKVG
jgi:hypothetical protein